MNFTLDFGFNFDLVNCHQRVAICQGGAQVAASQVVGKSVSGNFKLSDILPQFTVPESFVLPA